MRIYRYPDLRAMGVPYTRQYLGYLERAGKFPPRFKLTEGAGQQGSVGWDADAVDEHFRLRANAALAE